MTNAIEEIFRKGIAGRLGGRAPFPGRRSAKRLPLSEM